MLGLWNELWRGTLWREEEILDREAPKRQGQRRAAPGVECPSRTEGRCDCDHRGLWRQAGTRLREGLWGGNTSSLKWQAKKPRVFPAIESWCQRLRYEFTCIDSRGGYLVRWVFEKSNIEDTIYIGIYILLHLEPPILSDISPFWKTSPYGIQDKLSSISSKPPHRKISYPKRSNISRESLLSRAYIGLKGWTNASLNLSTCIEAPLGHLEALAWRDIYTIALGLLRVDESLAVRYLGDWGVERVCSSWWCIHGKGASILARYSRSDCCREVRGPVRIALAVEHFGQAVEWGGRVCRLWWSEGKREISS